MLASKKTRRGVIGAVVLASVLAVSGFALTSVIATPVDSHAGDGHHTVEALTTTAFKYTLGSTLTTNGTGGPNTVASITFHILGATTNLTATNQIYVQPVSVGATLTADAANGTGNSTPGQWYSCNAGTVTDPICDTTGVVLDAADIDQVRVVAADS